MQGTYAELRNLAVSQDLIERLIMAVTDVAIEVYTAPTETEQRKQYAVQVVQNPRGTAERMRFAIVFLAADNTDAKLKAAAKTVFGVLASQVTTSPPTE